MPRYDDVEVGLKIPEVSQTIEQGQLIAYAGASGDLNPLHWQEEFAAKVSPTGGIIAHGMLSLGLLSRVVTDWAGGPDRVTHLSASFRAPCPVGATLALGGEIVELEPQTRTAHLAVWAELEDGSRVIDRRRSRATVLLS